ncbi:hypothetical protein RB195_005121 [Necator americanus]|uniref:Uncharacterized protein n=1 Tax=Necator americanus TaxID=51031 RepID=A0ABR1BL97_NECAM
MRHPFTSAITSAFIKLFVKDGGPAGELAELVVENVRLAISLIGSGAERLSRKQKVADGGHAGELAELVGKWLALASLAQGQSVCLVNRRPLVRFQHEASFYISYLVYQVIHKDGGHAGELAELVGKWLALASLAQGQSVCLVNRRPLTEVMPGELAELVGKWLALASLAQGQSVCLVNRRSLVYQVIDKDGGHAGELAELVGKWLALASLAQGQSVYQVIDKDGGHAGELAELVGKWLALASLAQGQSVCLVNRRPLVRFQHEALFYISYHTLCRRGEILVAFVENWQSSLIGSGAERLSSKQKVAGSIPA